MFLCVACTLKAAVSFAVAHFLQDFSPRFLLEWLQDVPVLFAPFWGPASVLAAEIGVLLQSSGVADGTGSWCSLQAEDRLPSRFSQALTGRARLLQELRDTCSVVTIPLSNERKPKQWTLFFILSNRDDGYATRYAVQ